MIKEFGQVQMTFTMGINNWPTLKNLHIQHFGENITNNNDSLNNRNLVKNDLITCV